MKLLILMHKINILKVQFNYIFIHFELNAINHSKDLSIYVEYILF